MSNKHSLPDGAIPERIGSPASVSQDLTIVVSRSPTLIESQRLAEVNAEQDKLQRQLTRVCAERDKLHKRVAELCAEESELYWRVPKVSAEPDKLVAEWQATSAHLDSLSNRITDRMDWAPAKFQRSSHKPR